MSNRACVVHIDDRQSDLVLTSEPFISLVRAVLDGEQERANEVWLHFVPEADICELHSLHFGDPSPTDCISFPIDSHSSEPHRILGEVVVCPKVAKEYVGKEGGNVHQEVALYVVHGLLHLLGYDDMNPQDAETMREAEKRYRQAIEACARAQ